MIPRLELCGTLILARLLYHCRRVLNLNSEQVHTWTDSTIVLNWLSRSPCKFKTYVGNRIAHIVEMLPAQHWQHVTGTGNPADCASRGLMPSQLLDNDLWWHGPDWLRRDSTTWPKQPHIALQMKKTSFASNVYMSSPVVNLILSFHLIDIPHSTRS